MEQAADLFNGYEIRILFWAYAPGICRDHPGVATEADLGDELVGPAGDDGLTGGVAAWVVIVSPAGATLGVAAGPRAPVYRVDAGAAAIICEPQSGEQVS